MNEREHLPGACLILFYSCGVRENGGVLGIIFNWEALGQSGVNRTLISDAEKAHTRIRIVDAQGLVLADTAGQIGRETLQLVDQRSIFELKKGHVVTDYHGQKTLIAHAFSPGFETYATGWHSLIIQRLDNWPACRNGALRSAA